MDYSVFNPIAWLCFAGFCILAWGVVKAYHLKHPNYPNQGENNVQTGQLKGKEVAL